VLSTGAGAVLAWYSNKGARQDVIVNPSSVENFICNYTPHAFRVAVAETKTFLYRGENDIYQPIVLSPEPDLLFPETYDNDDALEYFKCLERRLNPRIDARPSLGHVATSDKSEAEQWGQSVSIWPLGDFFSYVWPRDSKVFNSSPIHCPNDELVIERDLKMALKQGHEVLFASKFTVGGRRPKELLLGRHKKSSFLALPAHYEECLLDLTETPEFLSYS